MVHPLWRGVASSLTQQISKCRPTTRGYRGQHVRDSLTLPLTQAPGRYLASKLCAHLRPKCHPVLLDSNINSHATVRLNLFQAFMLAAMKLHCHWAALPQRSPGDPRPLKAAIDKGLSYMVQLVRARCAAAHRRLGVKCRARVSPCHIKWLGLQAFHRVFGRKKTRYPALLRKLEAELAEPQYRHLSCQLAPVIDPAKSAIFDEIRF
eukprot:jgi/Botrbrau1/6093/Bobra.177_1s0031.1